MIAKRIRALDKMAAVRVASQTKTLGEAPTGVAMLVRSLHAFVYLAEDTNDPGTADLAIERAGFQEKAAWILRSMAA